jgi:hypothetical protein
MNYLSKVLGTVILLLTGLCSAQTPMIFCEDDSESCQSDGAVKLSTKFPQYFKFVDDILVIKSAEKTLKIHLNQPLTYESEDEKSISLDRYFPALNWLILREVYDGGESVGYQIIDIKNQLNTTDIASYPIISSDNSHFINYGIDLEAGFTLNGIVIYKIDPQGVIKEVFRHDDSWGVDSAEWINPNKISLNTRDYCNPEARDDLCEKKFNLENKNQVWELSPIK